MWNSSSQLLKKHYCPPNKPIFSTSPSKIKYWVIIFCQLSWVLESHILLWYLRFFSFLKSQFYSFGNSMIPIENTWQWIQIIQKNVLKKKKQRQLSSRSLIPTLLYMITEMWIILMNTIILCIVCLTFLT